MPRSRPDGNKFLERVEVLLNQGMGGFPHGTLALKEILEVHGGVEIYIPTATELYIAFRNRAIINEFKGDNYMEISLKYGASVSQIRRIVKRG